MEDETRLNIEVRVFARVHAQLSNIHCIKALHVLTTWTKYVTQFAIYIEMAS